MSQYEGRICVHRVRVGPQRKEEGLNTNLLGEVQEHTAKIKELPIGRDEQVVAASSGMWGEKYRDEVGRNRGFSYAKLKQWQNSKTPAVMS